MKKETKEIYLNAHIEKFWYFYNLDKNNENNSSFFFHMFFFLKENKINRFCYEFLKKIIEIENFQLIIQSFDFILNY